MAGAALDVFATEPTTESPLFGLDSVVVTPHLGASTREAQDKAGDTIADMVQLALAGEFVPFAVNLAVAEAHDSLRPFLPLAERLGGLFGSLVGVSGSGRCSEEPLPPTVEVCVEGEIGAHDTRIVGLAVLKGLFSGVSSDPVTYVNAPQRAKDHGLELREVSSTTSDDYVNLITVSGGGHSISGTLHWRRSEQRIVLVDGHTFDVPPVDHMVMITNDDRPGVIGTVGTLLGDAGDQHRRHGRRALRHDWSGGDADRPHVGGRAGGPRRPARRSRHRRRRRPVQLAGVLERARVRQAPRWRGPELGRNSALAAGTRLGGAGETRPSDQKGAVCTRTW